MTLHALSRILILGLLPTVLLLGTCTRAWAGSTRTAEGHLVRWDEGLDEVGRQTARQVPVVNRQVEAALGFPFRGDGAEVIIVRGLERMREEARVSVPQWAGGVCIGSRSRIVLRADLTRDGPLRSMVTTLRHEWVHLSWSRRAGANVRRLPLWMEEGLAEEIGGGITVDGGLRLDFAARFGRLIPFSEIDREWPAAAERAALAYRQGQSFVRFFRDRSGWDRIQRVLADLADGRGESDSLAAGTPFDELVLQHSGSTISHWHALWGVYVEETAAPWFHLLFRDLTGTLFFVVSLIGLVAYFFIRRSRKRQIEALPDHPPLAGQDMAEQDMEESV
jgi:hypothetical protein